LVINTHRLNSISFDSRCNHCDNHKGGVVTVGAGVMMKDVYEQAWARNLDILGGECPVSTILSLKKETEADEARLLVLRAATMAVAVKVPSRDTTVSVLTTPYPSMSSLPVDNGSRLTSGRILISSGRSRVVAWELLVS